MWGKVYPLCRYGYVARITPTHVGKSVKVGEVLNFDEDHPHPCGEKTK